MRPYNKALEDLDDEQRKVVNTIEGPLLVLAGPGTGKTQILAMRVAHILQSTDTLPQNVLCMTFTEKGAENMRQRLTRFIGQAAYDVNISTYHTFGSDLLRRFPQYFLDHRLQNPVDELGKYQLCQKIVEELSYLNPLKFTQHNVKDLVSVISEIKRALLTPDDLKSIARENLLFIVAANKLLKKKLANFDRMPPAKKAVPLFATVLTALKTLAPEQTTNQSFGSLATQATTTLNTALTLAMDTAKTSSLTKWKNTWLAKDSNNLFIFDGKLQNERLLALAAVVSTYQDELAQNGLYDFDDMILMSIDSLEQFADFRYTLQEQYLYILLDEFQDTNTSQLRLIQLLSDNPVNEGRPNVMAVGDDDQAIFAFQGANYSNMLNFRHMYRDVPVLGITKNYRSHQDILTTAQRIVAQIENRLASNSLGITKDLSAASKTLPVRAIIKRQEFLSDIAQYDWIARQIQMIIKNGVRPCEIALLAPKHKQLEPIIPYLSAYNIPTRYEKRENILEAPIVKELVAMSKLVLALHEDNQAYANALWPEVLSNECWQLPTDLIWRLAWQTNQNRHTSWSKELLNQPATRPIALLFLAIANRVTSETYEKILDYLIGIDAVATHDKQFPHIRSKVYDFYASTSARQKKTDLFYQALSHLTVLRAKLRDHQKTKSNTLLLNDLIDFVALYENADERMLNTSPYAQSDNAVWVMTAFKAKGLEFEHVFLLDCQDEVWGPSAREGRNTISLPANLSPIRHAGSNDDEQLRLFYVALTRAKYAVYLTSALLSYSGRTNKRLKYLDEQEQEDNSFVCNVLPPLFNKVIRTDHKAPSLQLLQLSWRSRHNSGLANPQLRDLLSERLNNYQLSPTHLNTFTDLRYGGPEVFFFTTILRFPQAPTTNGQFGNAIHETLQWLQLMLNEHGTLPVTKAVLDTFSAQLTRKHLTDAQFVLENERGRHALKSYLSTRSKQFKQGNIAEHNFRNEGVFVDTIHMSGKVDLLEINQRARSIVVVDYKTGVSSNKWKSDERLHKYRQQLYCYKLLIENSHTYKGYKVNGGRLEFVEPDKHGNCHYLEIEFKDQEMVRTKALLAALWQRIHSLDMPDVSKYDKTLSGIIKFENDLINDAF